MQEMSEQKPYLLRAIYQWLVDNQCTPHLLIAYPNKGWVSGVPEHLLQEEQLILNISPSAAPDCQIENHGVYFSARFSGQPYRVSVAMEAIAGLFARENQQGMLFDLAPEVAQGCSAPVKTQANTVEKKKPSHLKVVK